MVDSDDASSKWKSGAAANDEIETEPHLRVKARVTIINEEKIVLMARNIAREERRSQRQRGAAKREVKNTSGFDLILPGQDDAPLEPRRSTSGRKTLQPEALAPRRSSKSTPTNRAPSNPKSTGRRKNDVGKATRRSIGRDTTPEGGDLRANKDGPEQAAVQKLNQVPAEQAGVPVEPRQKEVREEPDHDMPADLSHFESGEVFVLPPINNDEETEVRQSESTSKGKKRKPTKQHAGKRSRIRKEDRSSLPAEVAMDGIEIRAPQEHDGEFSIENDMDYEEPAAAGGSSNEIQQTHLEREGVEFGGSDAPGMAEERQPSLIPSLDGDQEAVHDSIPDINQPEAEEQGEGQQQAAPEKKKRRKKRKSIGQQRPKRLSKTSSRPSLPSSRPVKVSKAPAKPQHQERYPVVASTSSTSSRPHLLAPHPSKVKQKRNHASRNDNDNTKVPITIFRPSSPPTSALGPSSTSSGPSHHTATANPLSASLPHPSQNAITPIDVLSQISRELLSRLTISPALSHNSRQAITHYSTELEKRLKDLGQAWATNRALGSRVKGVLAEERNLKKELTRMKKERKVVEKEKGRAGKEVEEGKWVKELVELGEAVGKGWRSEGVEVSWRGFQAWDRPVGALD